jgi:hypothetical protein
VRRKQRPSFERFLPHRDDRVRAYAQAVAAQDALEREAYRLHAEAREAEVLAPGVGLPEQPARNQDGTCFEDPEPEIPV